MEEIHYGLQIYRKKENNAGRNGYIVYMIVGSYFNKVTCKSEFAEKRLYLYYMDMREQTQEKKEFRIIRQAEEILKNYAPAFEQMNCEVVIAHSDDKYRLDFITGFEEVHAEVDINGSCELEVAVA